MLFYTGGIVILTVLINGSTTGWLMEKLEIVRHCMYSCVCIALDAKCAYYVVL